MGLAGVVQGLMAPVELQEHRPHYLNALSLEALLPDTCVTIVKLPVPKETRDFIARTDPDQAASLPAVEERQDIRILRLPTLSGDPLGFFVQALVSNLDGYSDTGLKKLSRRNKDVRMVSLAMMGIMPHLNRQTGRLLWEPRTYTIRTVKKPQAVSSASNGR